MDRDAVVRKAIAPARDRMQSGLVTGAIGLLLVVKAVLVGVGLYKMGTLPMWFWVAWAVSAGFALLVWLLRSATWPAAVLGGVICFNLLLAQAHGGAWWRTAFPALLALFLLTFTATRYGRGHKERLGTAEPKTGRRASQVIANLGVAGLCAGAASPLLFLACIAALAEATADTVSSELGQVLGGRTVLLTTLLEVPCGTDGGISVAGTLLGAASAFVITAIAAATHPVDLSNALLVFTAGTAGLLFDSLLGATVERRGWLGNDLVNFISTAFAAALAYGLIRWF